jgi:hypothetical protein
MQQVSLISFATFPLYIDILLKVEFMKVYMDGMVIYLEWGKSRFRLLLAMVIYLESGRPRPVD